MKEQILPQVMLQLTLSHCNDEVYFVSLLFEASPDWLDSDPSIRSLVQMIRRKIVTGAQNQLVRILTQPRRWSQHRINHENVFGRIFLELDTKRGTGQGQD